jgi:hypothetical protein
MSQRHAFPIILETFFIPNLSRFLIFIQEAGSLQIDDPSSAAGYCEGSVAGGENRNWKFV